VRREWDSNPRYPLEVNTLSRRASSTTPASLRNNIIGKNTKRSFEMQLSLTWRELLLPSLNLKYGFALRTFRQEGTMPQTILVAEDQQHVRSLVEYKLRNSGYIVICVDDGKAALEKAIELVPDLILLDVMMPLMTGFEVLGALRQNERTKTVPVLMVTALSKEDEVLKGLELGADDYITKPFSPNELAARVKTVLIRHGKK
jgi:CheY-like chemotaxis protein